MITEIDWASLALGLRATARIMPNRHIATERTQSYDLPHSHLDVSGGRMPHNVNLDALILREDFEVKGDQQSPSSLGDRLKISELTPTSLLYHILRKPDFQRETASWVPAKIAELIQCFLDGDLIPSVILWRSPSSGNLFVIDGAHRLSALIAWVHDDYGDKTLSRNFYNNIIPPEQIAAAEKTRDLVAKTVGSFQTILAAGQFPANSPEDHVRRARNLAAFSIQVQWVLGDAKRAEDSFFKINQKATPIDPTELLMIKSRKKPNAVAARALLRAGVGHKYWSGFPDDKQGEVEKLAKEVYDTLFTPALEEPIKTLDLPVAGRGYSAESVRLIFEFVNLANGLIADSDLKAVKADSDGTKTIEYLKKVRRLASIISGTWSGSLGLHPAVYFYGATGRYQPPAFLATISFLQWLDEKDFFPRFTSARDRFEEFLISHRYFTNQIVGKYGSGTRSLYPLVMFYRTAFEKVADGADTDAVIAALHAQPKLKFLRVMELDDIEYQKEFSRDTKSTVFLRDALQGAMRCKICNARIHKKSISVDHIVRQEDGGDGNPSNAQLTHLYCNTGYKEQQVAAERK